MNTPNEQPSLLSFAFGFIIVVLLAFVAITFAAEQAEQKRRQGKVLAKCVKEFKAYQIEYIGGRYHCVKFDQKGQKHLLAVGI